MDVRESTIAQLKKRCQDIFLFQSWTQLSSNMQKDTPAIHIMGLWGEQWKHKQNLVKLVCMLGHLK